MNLLSNPHPKYSWALAYLLNLGLALYLSQGVSALYPPYLLVLALAAMGLGISFLFLKIFHSKFCAPLLVFQIIQAAIGFAILRYVFNLSLLPSLTFSLGAILALFGFLVIEKSSSSSLMNLVLAGFYAGGLAVALRLGGVWGGLLWGLAILNGFFLGQKSLNEEQASLWRQGLLAASLLVVGRAAIQIYLLQSGYASLGVVITHPYTFLALFSGFLVPLVLQMVQREKILPTYLLIVLLGLVFPLALGVFAHVRPMGGYLMGLVVSSFAVEMFFGGNISLRWIVYLNLVVVNTGMPLFKNLANLNRWMRLEILGGIFIAVIISSYLLSVRRRASFPNAKGSR